MEMIDWNNKTIEQYIEHLEDKFRFDSSGTAKAVYELIAAYRAKNCNKPAVSKCVDVEREAAVCIASKDEGCYCKEVDMGCLECKYFRYKQTDC